MRVIQISDSHLFGDLARDLLGLNTHASFAAVVDAVCVEAASAKPDMVVLTGDISQDFSEQSYVNAAKVCERFACPVYWLPGNHDSPETMQKVFSSTQLKSDKAIIFGDWLFILLNTHYPKHVSGYLARSELAHLDYYLSHYPNQHTLVFLHHHPVLMNARWLDTSCLTNPDDFFEIIDKYPQIRGIVFGHVHQVFETHRKNIPILSAPSTCIQFLPGQKEFKVDNNNPGYRWFELSPDGLFKTGVERLKQFNNTVDFSATGY